jgi:hypothetical protein
MISSSDIEFIRIEFRLPTCEKAMVLIPAKTKGELLFYMYQQLVYNLDEFLAHS